MNKELSKFFSSDIINYCILPYTGPSKEDVKKIKDECLSRLVDFHKYVDIETVMRMKYCVWYHFCKKYPINNYIDGLNDMRKLPYIFYQHFPVMILLQKIQIKHNQVYSATLEVMLTNIYDAMRRKNLTGWRGFEKVTMYRMYASTWLDAQEM